MNIVQCPLIKLSPYEKNPRDNSAAVDKVAASIQEFGFQQPIVVDKHYVIVAGHTRYLAAQKLGLVEVPVVIADKLTPAQIRAYRLADNRTSEEATWDINLLKEEILTLNNDDYDLKMTGFDPDELDLYLMQTIDAALVDPEECPPLNEKETICKPGDKWRLGSHYLKCGDALNTTDLDSLMAGVTADMVFIDPPYNLDYNPDTRIIGGRKDSKNKLGTIKNDNFSDADSADFISGFLNNVICYTKEGAATYMSFPDHLPVFIKEYEKIFKISSILIWVKNHFSISKGDYHRKHEPILYGWKKGTSHRWHGDRKQSTILQISTEHGADYVHPTQKPTALIEQLVLNSSAPGQAVLDMFGGSGTTLIACEILNRRAFLLEIDPKYCDVIINRWQNYTGKKAELLT